MSIVIALDLGTTGNRAIAFNEKGEIISSAYYEFKQYYPKPAWVEHNPLEILSSTIKALKDVCDEVGLAYIKSIGITNQRETTVIWDKTTGNPVYNAIVWQCRRTTDRCISLKAEKEQVKQKTGLFLDPYFSATKIEWILKNVVSGNTNNLLFGTIDTWLVCNLTKGKVHATDSSNASRTMLYNIHTNSYDKELLDLFNVPESILPQVKETIDNYGVVDGSVLGKEIPIQAVIGDQQSALFCQCGSNTKRLKNTYGTGLFMMACTGDHLAKTENLVQTIAWRINGKTEYALEGSAFVGGSLIQWLRDELKIIKAASETEEIARSISSNEGVYLVPAFVGLGAPYWNPNARGNLIGLTRGTGRAHIVRAALESLAYQSQDILSDIQVNNPEIKFESLLVDGGAAKNNFLMQFQANISQLNVIRPSITETTAYGVAALAGIASGVWTEKQFRRFIKNEQIYEPNMLKSDQENLYKKWKDAVGRSLDWN